MAIAQKSEKIWRTLSLNPHNVYGPGNLAKLVNAAAARKPDQLPQLLDDVKADLRGLMDAGKISEVADDTFKARVFFDESRHIEHAYLGGMGNTFYRFSGSVFRINIGVLSVFFTKLSGDSGWLVMVNDATVGASYCLASRLKDQTYRIGCGLPKEDQDVLLVPGRYIESHHLDLTLEGEDVRVEDRMTTRGTRVDFLTAEGLSKYQEAAAAFLGKVTDPVDRWDPVIRGRYVINQSLENEQSLNILFFGISVDSAIFEAPKG